MVQLMGQRGGTHLRAITLVQRESRRPSWVMNGSRRERTIEIALIALFLTLLGYALFDFLQARADSRLYQPLQLALVAAAMMLQAVAALVRHRSRTAFYLALAISIALLAIGLGVRQ